MPTIRFPQPTRNIASATVIRWLKRAGDSFIAGDRLVELESEESLVVVEAADSGVLNEILTQTGQTVAVGTELARFNLAGTSASVTPAHSPLEGTVSVNQSTSGGGLVVPILMPQAGNTMEEGTVVNWQIKEGETITVGQIICEIETDKATIDFESPEAGRVARIVAPVGEPIAVKEPIALLAESDADADAFLAASQRSGESAYAASSSTPSVSPQVVARSAPVTTSGRVKASPAARKLAGQRGVELAAVAVGSGPGGRILRADVEHAEIATSANADDPPGCRRTPMSKMRRAIGLNLQASKQNVPHFYVRRTIDADPLLAFHADRKEATAATLNHVIVLAVGKAIGEFPEVRSQIAGNDVIEFPHANIGVAVAVDDGLVVPVVLAVDTMTLAELATETKRIVDNARQGRLDNIGKGNFTISNLGMFGVDEFSAIINPPESGILAVSAIRETVVAEKGAVRAGRTMMLTLSADHRVVDGVVAAKFMARLKEILEHPADELA